MQKVFKRVLKVSFFIVTDNLYNSASSANSISDSTLHAPIAF